MDLNVNSNMNAIGASRLVGAALSESHMSRGSRCGVGFTITHAVATPEEIAAAGIPDAALSRDDALGKLISGAFNLPPPPMPAFMEV